MWNVIAHAGEGTSSGLDDHMMDGGSWSGYGGFTMLWMFVGMVLIVAVVVYLLAQLAKRTDRSTNNDPIGIAKSRYAKGEITKKQFDEIKKDLK